MPHTVTTPTLPFSAMAGAVEVHQIPVWQDNFIWVLVCKQTGEAAVIDGPEAAPLLAYLDRHGLELRTILTTHTHPDHVGLHRELAQLGKLEGVRVIGNRDRAADIPGLTEGVGEGDRVRVGAVEGRVWLTEGHQNGHLTYVFGDLAFCGDTLFAGGCGYLFDGPPEAMHESLKRLASLDDSTLVCCAHEYTQDNLRFAWSVEPDNAALAERIREVWARREEGRATVPSTIGTEKATNPFLRWDSPTLVASLRGAMPERSLASPAEVFAAARALKDKKLYKSTPDSALPL